MHMHFILMQIQTQQGVHIQYHMPNLLFGEVMHNAYQLYSGQIWCTDLGLEVPQ